MNDLNISNTARIAVRKSNKIQMNEQYKKQENENKNMNQMQTELQNMKNESIQKTKIISNINGHKTNN